MTYQKMLQERDRTNLSWICLFLFSEICALAVLSFEFASRQQGEDVDKLVDLLQEDCNLMLRLESMSRKATSLCVNRNRRFYRSSTALISRT